MAKISVIIPVYNVENFLKRCLDSVINQLINEHKIFLNTQNKYEIIDDRYLIGTLEKTSKGSAYVLVD